MPAGTWNWASANGRVLMCSQWLRSTLWLGMDFSSFGTMNAEIHSFVSSCVDLMIMSTIPLAAVLPFMLLICVLVDRFFRFSRCAVAHEIKFTCDP